MDGDHSGSMFSNSRFESRRIKIVRLDVGFDENGFCADAAYSENGRYISIGRHDNLCAGTDVQHHQRQDQRVQAACDTDAVFCANVICKLLLESDYLLPQDIPAFGQDPRYGGVDVGLELEVGGRELKKRCLHCGTPPTAKRKASQSRM